MGHRLELQELLEDLLEDTSVYYQPPESIRMKYPCFVYSIDLYPTLPADDFNYMKTERYLVTYIDRNPDSGMPDKLLSTKGFRFDRHYVVDNLHHNVFTYTFY